MLGRACSQSRRRSGTYRYTRWVPLLTLLSLKASSSSTTLLCMESLLSVVTRPHISSCLSNRSEQWHGFLRIDLLFVSVFDYVIIVSCPTWMNSFIFVAQLHPQVYSIQASVIYRVRSSISYFCDVIVTTILKWRIVLMSWMGTTLSQFIRPRFTQPRCIHHPEEIGW